MFNSQMTCTHDTSATTTPAVQQLPDYQRPTKHNIVTVDAIQALIDTGYIVPIKK